MVFDELGLEPFDSTANDEQWSSCTNPGHKDAMVSDSTCLNALDQRLLKLVRLLDR